MPPAEPIDQGRSLCQVGSPDHLTAGYPTRAHLAAIRRRRSSAASPPKRVDRRNAARRAADGPSRRTHQLIRHRLKTKPGGGQGWLDDTLGLMTTIFA